MYGMRHYYSCANAFKLVFSAKAYCKVISRRAKIPHSIHSLSIPTIKYYRT